jgi:CheY-like chemotaxis protein
LATRHPIKTILITDDDSEDREILREAIETIDPAIKVIEAADGDGALLWLLTKVRVLPDLVLMDINMPLKNGFDALKEIKKSKKLMEIPVVMYSTTSNMRDMLRCKELGAKEFLVKPDSFEGLLKLLRPIILGHRPQPTNGKKK